MAWRTRKMTKFEEEAIKEAMKSGTVVSCYERGCGAPNIGLNLNLGRGVHNFPWLEFAKNWHSDEEFQELLSKYDALNDNYEKEVIRSSKLEDQNIGLKLQLQQQALPVVPECVAEIVELLKKNPETPWSKLCGSLGEEGVNWLNEFQHKDERFGIGELNNKLFVLFHLAINGYQVEKTQLFYLENKLTGLWLMRDEVDKVYPYDHTFDIRNRDKFTQQEIDSMETGSYEQIKVEEEK